MIAAPLDQTSHWNDWIALIDATVKGKANHSFLEYFASIFSNAKTIFKKLVRVNKDKEQKNFIFFFFCTQNFFLLGVKFCMKSAAL